MPEHSIRFAIHARDGRSSDVSKCWTTTGTGKRDVYLTSRPLGTALKLSLHEGGRWHIGFDTNRKGHLFEPGTAPASRFLGQWERPALGIEPVMETAAQFRTYIAAEVKEGTELLKDAGFKPE